jgi:propanol-preferring alcohol dehydrogenase
MRAMVLRDRGAPLLLEERSTPTPSAGELLICVEACAVCRTDIHIVDGDLAEGPLPIIPGHEIVGKIEAIGSGVEGRQLGERVGVPWLGGVCGVCSYCAGGRENLCDDPMFTGYTRNGGFATHVLVRADFAFPLVGFEDPVETAPLMCAGVIGWRSLRMAEDAPRVGLFGFGAAAHILAQVCVWQGREVYAFTRPGDRSGQDFARTLGAKWAGDSDDRCPQELDTAIIFAPVGSLVPIALKSVRKGGRVICGGIHMTDLPQFPYRLLWEERVVQSVANMTRRDATEFLAIAAVADVKVVTKRYALDKANEAIDDLRNGQVSGAAVLVP